jgi:hypothetical protein
MSKGHQNVFLKETEILNSSKKICESETVDKDAYEDLCRNYEDLLNQGKLITRVSDRLQNKLNNANEATAQKNIELQKTIDELTKTKISKKAITIVLILAIFLFILSEVIIDPFIEKYSNSFLLSLFSKGVIALLLKPLESFVESSLLHKAKAQMKVIKVEEA